jgi:hypothetical protein
MGDLIPLSILTLNNKRIDTLKYISLELKARGVSKNKYKSKSASIKELKVMLQINEVQRYVEEDEKKSGIKPKDVKVIKPISKRMRTLLPLVQELFRAKYKIKEEMSEEDES